MYLFLFLIFNFLFIKSYKNNYENEGYLNNVKKIENYELFNSIIDSNDICFFYFYDGKIVNLENEKLFNTKNRNISKIEEISFTNPYVKNKKVHFYEVDFSKNGTEKIVKFYKPEGITEIIIFYKGEVALRKKIEGDSIKSSNFILDIINDVFDFSKKTSKKRWSKKEKKITLTHSLNLNNDSNHCCHYSNPSFGINFGIGVPFYNWPGAYYGYGPYWGGPYYRPYMGMSYGISFGGHHGCHKR